MTPRDMQLGLHLESLLFLQEAVAASAALETAARLGVLDRLSAGPASASDLAHDCGIGERGARLLLSALAGLGLLDIGADGRYRAAFSGLSLLQTLFPVWACLADAIRDDRPPGAADSAGGAERLYPNVVPFLGALFAPAAERVAERLAAPGLRVLDVGAGAAPWSLALAARDPACQVTAVDWPGVLEVTRRAAAAAGYAARYSFLGGDFFLLDWGQAAYDLAVAGNICHLFDEAANRRLLERLFEALRPGGRVAIIDVLPNEHLDGPRPVVLYALGLLLRTTRGGIYPFSDYVGWLRDAGYESIERVDVSDAPPASLILASRP